MYIFIGNILQKDIEKILAYSVKKKMVFSQEKRIYKALSNINNKQYILCISISRNIPLISV